MKSKEEITTAIIALKKQALERWNNGNPDGFLNLSADSVINFDPALKEKLAGKQALTDYYENRVGKEQNRLLRNNKTRRTANIRQRSISIRL
jgi:hypothetical protein